MADSYTAAGGPRLMEFLDSLPIQTRWLHHHRVVWQTGQQNAPEGLGPMAQTHCSAFIAAVALMLDIYILRPPFHSQELLANAQADWLSGERDFDGPKAPDVGWVALGQSRESASIQAAVSAAARGQLAVAIYKAPPVTDENGKIHQVPGHACVVRPQAEEGFDSNEGPYVISVGDVNRQKTSMKTAFHAHRLAWPNNIKLFAIDTDLEKDS